MSKYDNYKKAKAIEKQNKKRLLEVNPLLTENSGIYFLTREDKNGIKHGYIGQARHILSRLAQHLNGYQQHIDLSIRKYGLYSEENVHGWRVGFMEADRTRLDELEQHFIKVYAQNGYQLKNKNSGGSLGKEQIAEYKPSKTYRDGILQGKKMLARELSHIIEKHLEIGLKEGKENNKISINALDKFRSLLDEKNYESGVE